MEIKIKRVYDPVSEADGIRILVDRLWPRGFSKERAHINLWHKEIAPSTDLRKWFAHKPERFTEFAELYRKELQNKVDILREIKVLSLKEQVTLVYSAKDTEMNQAVVLKQVLEEMRG